MKTESRVNGIINLRAQMQQALQGKGIPSHWIGPHVNRMLYPVHFQKA